MYEKPIAQVTKEHLVSHLPAYLDEVERLDKLKLVMPKTVEISSIVGGIMDHKHLPAYALDCQTKELSTTNEDLWTYIYVGQLTGMVSGKSALEVDDLIKGHKSACELFCVRHHEAVFTTVDTAFTIMGFEFSQSDFSGAIDVTRNPKAPIWVAAFQIGIAWQVSEEPPMQHA
jgi:hypothetical protein